MTEKPDISALLPDDATLTARRRALEAELRRPRRRLRRAPRRRLGAAVLALVALGGGAAWAAGVFSAQDISFRDGVGCYSEARLHGPRLSVTVTRAAADPVAKCERYWREGVVDTVQRRLAREGKIEYPRGRYPPRLVACARPGSGIAVFPGAEAVCEKLGFESLPRRLQCARPRSREGAYRVEPHPGATLPSSQAGWLSFPRADCREGARAFGDPWLPGRCGADIHRGPVRQFRRIERQGDRSPDHEPGRR